MVSLTTKGIILRNWFNMVLEGVVCDSRLIQDSYSPLMSYIVFSLLVGLFVYIIFYESFHIVFDHFVCWSICLLCVP